MKGVLVGCGYFAGIHLDAWARLRDRVRIEAVCDIAPQAAQDRAGQYGIPRCYTSFETMLDAEKPDFVDIVTRPGLHGAVVRAAVDRGCHILCQKPIAPTYQEAEDLVSYCDARAARFMVNENWRWQAWYREVARLLDSGIIGRPYYFLLRHRTTDGAGPAPYPKQPYLRHEPNLLLIETMIHFLDTARFLFGDFSVRSSCVQRLHPGIAGDELVILTLEGRNIIGVVDGNRLSAPEHDGPVSGDLRVEGDLGALSLLGDGRILIRPLTAPAYEHVYLIPTIGYRGDSAFHTHQHFVDCLAAGTAFETDGRDYLKTTQLVFDGYRLANWQVDRSSRI